MRVSSTIIYNNIIMEPINVRCDCDQNAHAEILNDNCADRGSQN